MQDILAEMKDIRTYILCSMTSSKKLSHLLCGVSPFEITLFFSAATRLSMINNVQGQKGS